MTRLELIEVLAKLDLKAPIRAADAVLESEAQYEAEGWGDR